MFAIQNIWRPEEKFGIASINRQIQKYVANHNKDGPKTKIKMKTFLTALSSVLYITALAGHEPTVCRYFSVLYN
jgi:hypothetical protein